MAVIKITPVSGAEPPVVSKDLFRLVLEIAVASKNIRTARQNFADLVPVDALFFFERFRIDANLHAGKRFSHAVSPRFPGQIQREQRRGLGEAVTDSDLPPQRFEFRSQLWVERRAAGSEQSKFITKTFVQRTKQKLANTEAEPLLHEPARGEECAEQSARDPAGRFHPGVEPGIKRAVKPGHTDYRRHFALSQRAQQLLSAQRKWQNQWQAKGERVE